MPCREMRILPDPAASNAGPANDRRLGRPPVEGRKTGRGGDLLGHPLAAAVAVGQVKMQPETLRLILQRPEPAGGMAPSGASEDLKKGDVLAVARLARFLERAAEVRALGFDDRFIRMWEYYLALCEAGFATGLSQDHQLVLEKARGLGHLLAGGFLVPEGVVVTSAACQAASHVAAPDAAISAMRHEPDRVVSTCRQASATGSR